MKRTALAVAVIAALTLTVGTVLAAGGGTKVCVPTKEGKPITTPKGGTCKAGTLTELGAEGKEGPEGKEGKEGAKGATGSSGSAAAVNANGSVRNGKIAASNPGPGEYVISWNVGVFPTCSTIVEAQQIATVVTPFLEGPAVMADTATTCMFNEPQITVTIFSNTGVKTENGFSLISLKAA